MFLFHRSNDDTNASHCYVIPTPSVFFNLISKSPKFQVHKHIRPHYVRHRPILLPMSVWQCSKEVEMGCTCNTHDQDETHKLHATKHKYRAKLVDTVVDGIMLKCPTATEGTCRLGVDSTGLKSLKLSHMVTLKLHTRRCKTPLPGRSAVTGRN